jgi:hypothetical protein
MAVAVRTLLRRFLPPSMVPGVACSRYHATLRTIDARDLAGKRIALADPLHRTTSYGTTTPPPG